MANWAIEVAGRFLPLGLGNFDAHVLGEVLQTDVRILCLESNGFKFYKPTSLEKGDEALAHLSRGQ